MNTNSVGIINRIICFIVISVFLPEGIAVCSEQTVRVRILEKYHPEKIIIKYDESIYEYHSITLDSKFPVTFSQPTVYQIAIPGTGIDRFYAGTVEILKDANELMIINTVPIEDYTASVVLSEMGQHHTEAMCAQAVLSRTWALANLKPGKKHDFCDLTISQSYQGKTLHHQTVKNLISKTGGEVLTYRGKPANIMYHAGCSDRTFSAYEIWGGDRVPYLTSVKLPKEAIGRKGIEKWRVRIPKAEIDTIVSGLTGVVAEYHYLLNMRNGRQGIHTGISWIGIDRFRLAVNRKLGWNTLKSNAFSLDQQGDELVFTGRGFGHLVGLCQKESVNLAENGWSYSDILNLFYPGCNIRRID